MFEEEGLLPFGVRIRVFFGNERMFHLWTGTAQAVRGWRKEGMAWDTIEGMLDEWDEARPYQIDYTWDEMSEYARSVNEVVVHLPYT